MQGPPLKHIMLQQFLSSLLHSAPEPSFKGNPELHAALTHNKQKEGKCSILIRMGDTCTTWVRLCVVMLETVGLVVESVVVVCCILRSLLQSSFCSILWRCTWYSVQGKALKEQLSKPCIVQLYSAQMQMVLCAQSSKIYWYNKWGTSSHKNILTLFFVCLFWVHVLSAQCGACIHMNCWNMLVHEQLHCVWVHGGSADLHARSQPEGDLHIHAGTSTPGPWRCCDVRCKCPS